jgi:hypothetical protein
MVLAYNEYNKAEISALLLGHRVTKVTDDTLQLDDGRLLTFVGNDGGCACGGGDYNLTELNGVDNIITHVEYADEPGCGDWDSRTYSGYYKIFVFAGHQRINLATFTGDDGSGYYGTGYAIHVRADE